jgi:hypothetical protein
MAAALQLASKITEDRPYLVVRVHESVVDANEPVTATRENTQEGGVVCPHPIHCLKEYISVVPVL